MIYTVVKRRHAYFYCAGARRSQCDQAYMSATTLEHELIRHYSLVKLDDDFRATVTEMLDETVRRGQSWCKTEMVELRGLEPLTPSLRTRCATSCATAPDAVAADATISRQG
jgi:hypothetical protein